MIDYTVSFFLSYSIKGAISTRRPQLADSEKTEEQLNEQYIHSVAEMKVLLGVSHNLYTALITNPRLVQELSTHCSWGHNNNNNIIIIISF